MILVTLGTQDKSFVRLLEAIQKGIDEGKIIDEVVVQAGNTKFYSKDMMIYSLLPMDEFERLIKNCDLLITHGGVGSIMSGINNNKKIIAAARLKRFNEHTNDHQIQIIKEFSKRKLILELDNFDRIDKIIEKAKKYNFKRFESNSFNMVSLIKTEIDKYIKF